MLSFLIALLMSAPVLIFLVHEEIKQRRIEREHRRRLDALIERVRNRE